MPPSFERGRTIVGYCMSISAHSRHSSHSVITFYDGGKTKSREQSNISMDRGALASASINLPDRPHTQKNALTPTCFFFRFLYNICLIFPHFTSLTRVTTSSQPRWASLGDTLQPKAGLAAPVICEMESSRASVGALTLLPLTTTTPSSSASESGTCSQSINKSIDQLINQAQSIQSINQSINQLVDGSDEPSTYR